MADIQPEERLRSETVYQGKLVDLRKDTVRLPNGKTAMREVVVHPEVIVVLPILDDGRLVLVRQYREAVGKIMLEIPAGGIDDGESPEDAVRREMAEETGYRVGSLEHVTSFYSSPGFTTELMHFYLATGLEPGQPTEDTDQIQVVLLSYEEAMDRMRNGEVPDAKSVAALALYGLRERQ
jgi:ADP-ribose pyrophosphatase